MITSVLLTVAEPARWAGAPPTNLLALVAGGAFLLVLLPVLGAVGVFTWHGLRGTDPGPAAVHLLSLVTLVLDTLRRTLRPAMDRPTTATITKRADQAVP